MYTNSITINIIIFLLKGSIQFHSGDNKEKDTIDKMMDNVIEIEGIEDIKEVDEDTLEVK